MCVRLIVDAMRANPRMNQLWKQNSSKRKVRHHITVYDPNVGEHAHDLIWDTVEQCYRHRVLRRVFYDSDEDAVEDVNEVAVDDEMDYEDKDGDEVEDEDINHPNLFF